MTRSRQPLQHFQSHIVESAVLAVAVGVVYALVEPAICRADALSRADTFGKTDAPISIRSRRVELAYRLVGASAAADVELWYTRDRAATWQNYGIDEDRVSPFIFVAPAEGLYGFTLIARDGLSKSREPPAQYERAQRWVFIDYTPPLVQWDGVEPADAFHTTRTVHLRWTAYDDNLPTRCVSLLYQSSVEQKWQLVDAALPNLGRYDWVVPKELNGQISLKLVVSDLGGHVIERIYGPVSLEQWLVCSNSSGVSTTQPGSALPAHSNNSDPDQSSDGAALASKISEPGRLDSQTYGAESDIGIEKDKAAKADKLYQQGKWHRQRGQYAVAAERFREALEIDPGMLAAMSDLAGIYYTMQNYSKAIELYNAVLTRDGRYVAALRGAVLAYDAKKQYPRELEMLNRLLAINETDAVAWLDLGDVSFMMGDQGNARRYWTRASTVDPSAESIMRKARKRLQLYGYPEPVVNADTSANQ